MFVHVVWSISFSMVCMLWSHGVFSLFSMFCMLRSFSMFSVLLCCGITVCYPCSPCFLCCDCSPCSPCFYAVVSRCVLHDLRVLYAVIVLHVLHAFMLWSHGEFSMFSVLLCCDLKVCSPCSPCSLALCARLHTELQM